MSSRIIYSQPERPVAVEITTPDVGLEVGFRFAVLGTEISMTSGRVQWTGTPSGRPPSIEEVTEPRRRVGTRAGDNGTINNDWKALYGYLPVESSLNTP